MSKERPPRGKKSGGEVISIGDRLKRAPGAPTPEDADRANQEEIQRRRLADRVEATVEDAEGKEVLRARERVLPAWEALDAKSQALAIGSYGDLLNIPPIELVRDINRITPDDIKNDPVATGKLLCAFADIFYVDLLHSLTKFNIDDPSNDGY